MQNRSYEHYIGRLQELDVPAFEATSKKFAASVAAPSTIGANALKLAGGMSVVVVGLVSILMLLGDSGADADARIASLASSMTSSTASASFAKHSSSATAKASAKPILSSHRTSKSILGLQGIAQDDLKKFDQQVGASSDKLFAARSDEEPLELTIDEADPKVILPPTLDAITSRQINIASPFEIGEGRALQLTILGSKTSDRANPDGRIMLAWEITNGLFVGLAAGAGYETSSVTRFSGFQDTTFEYEDGDMPSRIGQFKTVEEPRAIYHGGLSVVYRPASFSIGPLQPGLTMILGFEGSRLMCEPALALNLTLNERWGFAGSLGTRLYPMVEHPIGIAPSLGITANF